ncbi:hypothetical protein [Streptomyces sp. NPDC002845]
MDAAGARDTGDVLEELDGVASDIEEEVPAPEQPHAIDVPGLLAEHLKATDVAEIRDAWPDDPPRAGLLGARHRSARTPPERAEAVRRRRRRRLHPGRTQGVPHIRRPDRRGPADILKHAVRRG